MYQPLLTNRYLTTRVIPLIAVAAVGLCVGLVIIVVSVMTGFLDMVKDSGRTLIGDVVVSYPVSGLPYYERLMEKINELPEAAASTPTIDSFGLLKMPYPDGPHKQTRTVQVWGVDPATFSDVTGYEETLYWRPLAEDELETAREDDPRRQLDERILQNGLNLYSEQTNEPGVVMGILLSDGNDRLSDGSYQPARNGYWWMPRFDVTLTMLPITQAGGTLDPESRILPVVNEFESGVYVIDDNRVMLPLNVVQEMIQLNAAVRVDPDDPDIILGEVPARATMVLVRAADGVTPEQLKEAVEGAYDAFFDELANDESLLDRPPPLRSQFTSGAIVQTWLEQQAAFIGPIEKERELMRTLFSIVYLVVAGLVLSIFWAIVYEKTRDIGILRSVGATRMGISWIFLRYGLIVGALGAALGLGLAYLVVRNINTIHDLLGQPPVWAAVTLFALGVFALGMTVYKGRRGDLLPIVLGAILTIGLFGGALIIALVNRSGGVVIWDPSVYLFNEIPNKVDFNTAWITMIGAVLFCLLGAFIPAAKAADTDPVKALRYE